jgi:hypothetical protein
LRPGGRPSPINYNALRGHMIVIPQDPGPLLHILPSPELRLDNLIKVFWLGKRAPADNDLKPFLQVRKDKVLAALQYLVQHNHLYHNLTINHGMIDGWTDDFIPPEIVTTLSVLRSLIIMSARDILLVYKMAITRTISMQHKMKALTLMTTKP